MNISLDDLYSAFLRHNVSQVIAKPLAENDNTKQQVYLGKGFDALTLLPFGSVRADATVARPNFKSSLDFFWLAPTGHFVNAPFAQLILYPDYPEVRLSGFLRGCPAAPSGEMQPVPADQRGPKGVWDGRVLFLGTSPERHILAVLASKDSHASMKFEELRAQGAFQQVGVLFTTPLGSSGSIAGAGRVQLLNRLREINALDFVQSQRLYADGTSRPYAARNGGGYTLEALLGIKPNAKAEPDFLGWELKAYGQPRVTLMTPEPDGGYYGEHGMEAFVRKYGRVTTPTQMYFTGVHRVGHCQSLTGHTMTLVGFNSAKGKIDDVNGGICLLDAAGEPAALWSYPDLIKHWGRKHANAAYVPYRKSDTPVPTYKYGSPVLLGTGTDFSNFLQAMHSGKVVYDPGCKLTLFSGGRVQVKPRNQFRIHTDHLSLLYDQFESVAL